MFESLTRYLPELERRETVKLKSEPIKVGPVPMG